VELKYQPQHAIVDIISLECVLHQN